MDIYTLSLFGLILALIVGEVVWVVRGREFSALHRLNVHLIRKLADAQLRLDKQRDVEAYLAEARVRLEDLAKLEQELHDERKSASDLKDEIARLRMQAKEHAVAYEAQILSLSTLLRLIGDHIKGLGTHLNRSASKFNEVSSGLEGNVMPRARRLGELGMAWPAEPLTTVDPAGHSAEMSEWDSAPLDGEPQDGSKPGVE